MGVYVDEEGGWRIPWWNGCTHLLFGVMEDVEVFV
jgi:hypothetical protein